MPTIEPYAAKGVYNPPIYAQAIKAKGIETVLFIAGQVDYDDNGGCAHPGDFKAQARAVLAALKAQVEAGGEPWPTSSRSTPTSAISAIAAITGRSAKKFFGLKMPAHTLVAVAGLASPEFLIEVEAIAVL